MEEERRLMYVAITRAKTKLYLTRSKSRYLYGKREPTMRSRFLKELSSELELPQETRPMPMGYGDYDDPDSYGNSAYGGGRYATNNNYGGYGKTYGGYGGRDTSRENSTVKRSTWNGGYGGYSSQSASGFTYGASNASHTGASKRTGGAPGGFTYGSVGKGSAKPIPTGGGKDLSAFKVGVQVSHPKFGKGVIVSMRGISVNTILDVAFEGLGIKQLSATLAPLTLL